MGDVGELVRISAGADMYQRVPAGFRELFGVQPALPPTFQHGQHNPHPGHPAPVYTLSVNVQSHTHTCTYTCIHEPHHAEQGR